MTRTWIAALFALGLALTVVGGPRTARAQHAAPGSRQRAGQLVDEGVKRFQAGDFDAALERFRAAYDAFPSPKIYLNIGEALRRLGREAEAAEAYAKFLSETAEARDVGDAKRRLALNALDELSRRLARLRLEVEPSSAAIQIDGQPFTPPSGRGAFVSPGRHRLSGSAPGRQDRSLEITLTAGEERELRLVLERPSTPPVVAESHPPRPPARTVAVRDTEPSPLAPLPPPSAPETDQSAAPRTRTWTWVAAGTTGALLLGGVIFGVQAGSAYDEYKTTTDLARYHQLRDEVGSKSTLANVFFIGAGAAAVATGVLFYFEGRPPKTEEGSAGRLQITPTLVGAQGGVGMQMAGRF
jgi:hypothetical protein